MAKAYKSIKLHLQYVFLAKIKRFQQHQLSFWEINQEAIQTHPDKKP